MFRFMMHHRRSSRGRAYPLVLGGLLAASLLVAGGSAKAQTYYFTATDGAYSAEASFFNNGNNTWSLVLKNKGAAASLNDHVLTGLFWTDSVTSDYGALGAAATTGSIITNDNGVYTGTETVAQHWGYDSGLVVQNNPNGTSGPITFNQGVGATGFSDGNLGFGDSDVFAPGGSNPLINGVDWGIVSGFAPGGINGNENPFVKDSATFTFQGQVAGSQFSAVRFQYGSSLGQKSMISTVRQIRDNNVVPEGDGVLLLLAGGLPLVGMMIHRRKKMSGSVA